jgi:hypothetical protein
MTARKVSTAELARRTTIRSIRQGKGGHRRSTLVTLAAGLGWPLAYLLELAAGEPPSPPPAVPLARVERKLDAVLGYLGIRAR